MSSKTQLLIADNHVLFAEVCQYMLQREFEVVGVVSDGRALVQATSDLKPDIVILEVGLSQLNGLDAADQIKRKLPRTKLVFTTADCAPRLAAEAFRRGASGYLPKQARCEELVTAIRKVALGESYLSALIPRQTVDRLLYRAQHEATKKHITPRQAEVLQLLAEGRTMKQIAGVLNISPGTVAFHKYKMMESLDIQTNAGLLQYAMRNHIPPP